MLHHESTNSSNDMNTPPQNFSIFIDSLLSSKNISIDQHNDNNKTVQITECSIFNHSKMVIPLDLISAEPKISKRPDAQWLLFGVLSLLAAGLFFTMAFSQQLTIPYYLSAGFILSSLFSVYAAYKQANTRYSYQCRETHSILFSLTKNDLNSPQIAKFLTLLNAMIVQSQSTQLDATYSSQDSMEQISNPSTANPIHTGELHTYYQYLEFLYEKGIINSSLLEELEQRAYNKVYGIMDSRPLAKVIPLPMSR